MKTNSFFVGLIAAVLLTSCNADESTMLTVINEDGTCSREISFHPSPQGAMAKADEPIEDQCLHFGTDWKRTWSVVGEDSLHHAVPMTREQWDSLQRAYPKQNVASKILLHCKRDYQSVGEMSDSLTHLIEKLFDAKSTLEKHFKWFYTDYVFEETFSLLDSKQYFPIPIEDYLSADTASYWYTGLPDLTKGLTGAEQKEMLDGIEAQVSRWVNANAFAYVYDYIGQVYYKELKNPPVSQERFLALRDTLVKLPAVQNMSGNMSEQISGFLKDYYHSDVYSNLSLFHDDEKLVWVMNQKYRGYELLTTMMAYHYDLVMPGRVLDSGIGTAEGHVIHYKFSAERLIPHDYIITATSRVTNVWAFIVTFLIILLAVGSFFYHPLRLLRRRELG
jgi:hypothetical protein